MCVPSLVMLDLPPPKLACAGGDCVISGGRLLIMLPLCAGTEKCIRDDDLHQQYDRCGDALQEAAN